jgi:hypothetical protein
MTIRSGDAITITSNVENPSFVLTTGSPADDESDGNVNEEAFEPVKWIPGVGLVRKR